MNKQSKKILRDEKGRFIKGNISWTKIYGNPKIRGKNNPMKEKENKEKISKAMMRNKNNLGNKLSEETKRKIAETHKGRKLSKKHKRKLSKAKIELYKKQGNIIGFQKGERHYGWQGGTSREPYLLGFNKKFKEQIRKRDNYTCQKCGYTEKQLGYKLRIHHIDYNKKNNNPNSLISLCKSCHSKTNFQREDWGKYFYEKAKDDIRRRIN